MNMKQTKIWVSGLSSVLVLGLAVGFAMEQPEVSTLFSVFSQENPKASATELDLYADLSLVNRDIPLANELSKIFRIAVTTLEDWENSIGTTVTWHTTATDGVYISTNEPEENKLIQTEIYWTLGSNGAGVGGADSDWGKEFDITFILSSIDGFPHIYTENESLAYHLGISTSPDDLTAIPTSDPRAMTANDEASIYEYYAFKQDIAPIETVLDEYFCLLSTKTDEFTVGDTLTWTLDRNTSSKFVINQQNGKTIQGYVDEVLATQEQNGFLLNLPSASEILKEVDVTFEVAQSLDGTLFLFTEDLFISTIFSIPVNEIEEFNRIEVDHHWFLRKIPSDDWWKEGIVSTDMQIDVSTALELLKISRIFVAQSDEIPELVTVTWHSDLAGDSLQPRLSVTGENEEMRAYMEAELFNLFGEYGAGIEYILSEEAQKIPFSFTIVADEDGIPQFLIHDQFWAEHLDLPQL